MKKNNLIKILTSVSTAVLLGIGINSVSNSSVDAASTLIGTSTDKTVNITKDDNGTIHFEPIFSTFDVTVKKDNPILLDVDSSNSIKTEKSDYKAGKVLKVEYSVDFTTKDTNQPVKGYFLEKKTVDGKEVGVFILETEVDTSASIPTKTELGATVKTNLTNAQEEYKEKLQKEANLKKRVLYYTVKKKSTKKALYYYTGYTKTSKVKKTKKTKTTFIFKKNKYKIKTKTLKIDQAKKVGKSTYYHIKGKSANFWVRSTDVKDLKPVFRKK